MIAIISLLLKFGRGVSYAAGKLDVNLVVFFGGFVGSSNIYGNSRYEFQKIQLINFPRQKI